MACSFSPPAYVTATDKPVLSAHHPETRPVSCVVEAESRLWGQTAYSEISQLHLLQAV